MPKERLADLRDALVIMGAIAQIWGFSWFMATDHAILMAAVKSGEQNSAAIYRNEQITQRHEVSINLLKQKVYGVAEGDN